MGGYMMWKMFVSAVARTAGVNPLSTTRGSGRIFSTL
jgi:hypothetical protein